MCPLPYYRLMRQSKDPRYVRLQMVRLAQQDGVKPTARTFATTPKTVRLWLRRYQANGYAGLKEWSRAPKHPARRITPAQRRRAIQLKKELPAWGAARIKRLYGLRLSEKALRRIWQQEGLLQKKRRKHRTKNDLRAVKQQWRLFEQIDVDTKDLDDIPELWPQIRRFRLPLVQYTAREVVSGLHFMAYAQQRSLSDARRFVGWLLEHLQGCGAPLTGSRIQTDNGSEFIGSWQAQSDSAFTRCVQAAGLRHQTIPPGAHTWQADVETAHRLIEDEFYQVESFQGRSDFLHKAATYNLWFNTRRQNSYKANRTPWEVLHARDPTLPPKIVTFPPLFLDEFFDPVLPSGGYDVIPYPCFPTAGLGWHRGSGTLPSRHSGRREMNRPHHRNEAGFVEIQSDVFRRWVLGQGSKPGPTLSSAAATRLPIWFPFLTLRIPPLPTARSVRSDRQAPGVPVPVVWPGCG